MDVIEEVYEDCEADIDLAEFREAVEERVEKMGGLADKETAAMLVAHELDEPGGEVDSIAAIEPDMEEVKFVGKVIDVGELRTFERDGDDPDGQVCNVDIGDETGTVRVAFWDEMAGDATETLTEDSVLRIKGRPKEGYAGVEVSADTVEEAPDVDIEVATEDSQQIEDLTLGRSDVNLKGRVLQTESVRTFERDDGEDGKVANLVLGDPTGRVRVTMWDSMADTVNTISANESVEVVSGYVRERDGDLELHVGEDGAIEPIEEDVEYDPDTTPIEAIDIGETVDIGGVVRSTDPKRTFDRDDGSEGQVRNVRIQDETGDIRVALWGDLADREIGPGDEVVFADVEIQEGWEDDLEASANWQSTVSVLDSGAEVASSDGDTGLDSFGNGSGSGGQTTDEQSQATQQSAGGQQSITAASTDTESATGTETKVDAEPADTDEDSQADAVGESIEFTGTVVQGGDPVVLDNGEETVTVETHESVHLGEELTVTGTVVERGRIDAEELF